MPKVSLIHTNKNLFSLFEKEQEVVERITPFCNKTDRDIESLYSLSSCGVWKLEVKTFKNERKK